MSGRDIGVPEDRGNSRWLKLKFRSAEWEDKKGWRRRRTRNPGILSFFDGWL